MTYTDGVHLIADTIAELHEFAQGIGLKREWYQKTSLPHYDLMGSKIRMAITAGARRVHPRALIKIGREIYPYKWKQMEEYNK